MFNTIPNNPFPPSTEQMHRGDNEELQSQINTLKSGLTNVDVALSVPENSGKNVLPMSVEEIKSGNTDGTWNGNTYTHNGISYTINTDSNGNVTSITVNGTASSNSILHITSNYDLTYVTGKILNGMPSGTGIEGLVFLSIAQSNDPWTSYQDFGDGVVIGAFTGNKGNVYIRVYHDQTVNNALVKPMIRPATITDPTFAPYIPSVESRIEAVESVVTNLNQLYIGKGSTNLVSAIYAGFITGSGNYVDFFIPCAYDNTISSVSLHSSAKFSIYTFNGTLLTQGYIDFTNATVVKTEHGLNVEMKFLETQTTYANTIVNIAFGQSSAFTFS